jgi:hypothetical protein
VDEREKKKGKRRKGKEEREKKKGKRRKGRRSFPYTTDEGEKFGAEIRRGERGEAGKGETAGKEKTRQLHHRRFHQFGVPALSQSEDISRTSPILQCSVQPERRLPSTKNTYCILILRGH